jgi:short-subunit dehydrogenase
MSELRNKTVVVTGASAGVGRAIVHRFARDGAALGLIARDREALEAVAAEVRERGGRAFVAPADTADAGAVFAAADRIAQALGPIEIWINDAMVTVFGRFWDITPEEYRRVTEVTYLGYVHGTLAALRHMRPANRGAIIQIGSALAYRGIPLQSAYCGAKFAIRGFTDSLRSELIHAGSPISLTMVQLPAVNTPQFDWARTHMPHQPRPVAPVYQPEAIAEVVRKAALEGKREYWIGKSSIELILADLVAPGYFDRMLARKAFGGQARRQPVHPGRRDNLMAPVTELHRTRGSFGSEASSHAVTTSGPAARMGTVLAGGLALVAVGWLARRLVAPRG